MLPLILTLLLHLYPLYHCCWIYIPSTTAAASVTPLPLLLHLSRRLPHLLRKYGRILLQTLKLHRCYLPLLLNCGLIGVRSIELRL